MVAYNMMLGVIPLALLALFVSGQVLVQRGVEHSVIVDLREVFPGTADQTLESLLDQVRTLRLRRASSRSSPACGSDPRCGARWTPRLTASTAASRDSWLRQKRFALSMVGVVLLFMLATVSVPTVQSILNSGVHALPFDLSHVAVIGLAGGSRSAWCCCSSASPSSTSGCRTSACRGARCGRARSGRRSRSGSSTTASRLPVAHLDDRPPGRRSCSSLIVLGWFYVLAIIILGGAIVNALRLRPPGPDD